jgi:transposase
MKVKYEDRQKQKVIAITTDTLVVGVDIAKNYQWARFVDFRGIEHDRALKFKNSKGGFETILARIREICKKENFAKAVVGMEPTGHYWKAFLNWLEKQDGIKAVLVNPYATKQAKELDDNSQTKSDKKDALTIAKLVKDGRYFELYLPHDVYAELRGLSTTRTGLNKRKNALKNTITAVMDEYFPEYEEVFKCPLSGKASRHILKTCPFPKFILELGEDGVTDEIKKAVKKTVGRKKAAQLIETAKESIGVDYGEEAALQKTDYAGFLLSIKGIGVVTLAACLGELGNPARFENPRQMSRMAGYNLVEDSSGKNKSGTKISKRGRKNLRSVLYQMALIMVATNDEMKQLYHYLKTREEAPLRKMQALIVVSKKILALIHALAKKKENYDPGKVFGHVRREQMKAAA